MCWSTQTLPATLLGVFTFVSLPLLAREKHPHGWRGSILIDKIAAAQKQSKKKNENLVHQFQRGEAKKRKGRVKSLICLLLEMNITETICLVISPPSLSGWPVAGIFSTCYDQYLCIFFLKTEGRGKRKRLPLGTGETILSRLGSQALPERGPGS